MERAREEEIGVTYNSGLSRLVGVSECIYLFMVPDCLMLIFCIFRIRFSKHMDKTNEWIKHMNKWRSKEYATAWTKRTFKTRRRIKTNLYSTTIKLTLVHKRNY